MTMNKKSLQKRLLNVLAVSSLGLFCIGANAQNGGIINNNQGNGNNTGGMNINYQQPSDTINGNADGVNSTTTKVMGQGMMTPAGQIVPATSSPPVSLPGMSMNINSSDPNAKLLELLNADPNTIRRILKDIESREKASKDISISKATQSTVNLHITPGSSVPVFRTFANRNSSLVIMDQTGKPWPIENFAVGGSNNFTVRRLDKSAGDKGYMLDITPNENFISGNLTLKLENLDVPVVLEMVSGQKEYDSPLTVRVMAKGPNSSFTDVRAPEKTDSILYSILQGVAPGYLKALNVENGLAQAWLSKDGKTMYVRSNLKIMTFEHMTSSPDGTYAYRTTPLPVLTYKYENRFGQINIKGF